MTAIFSDEVGSTTLRLMFGTWVEVEPEASANADVGIHGMDLSILVVLLGRVGPERMLATPHHWSIHIWWFPEMGVTQYGRFIVESPIKMDDLGGVPPF